MKLRLPAVLAIAVVCLLPFIGKPFHTDDPLFLWAADRIHAAPLDPYGFDVNWYGTVARASGIIKNPPLASYVIAGATAIGGRSEIYLHLVFLLFAATAIAGTYKLAESFDARPDLAALLAVACPVLMVSSTGVTCELLMLSCWVWSVWAWRKGTEDRKVGWLVTAALLVAAAALSKYFAASLIPLLGLYTLMRRDRPRACVAWLLIPIAILSAYQAATGLLFDAASYATGVKKLGAPALPSSLFVALAFAGGSLAPVLFLGPAMIERKRRWVPFALAALLVAPATAVLSGYSRITASRPLLTVELAVMAAGGAGLVAWTALEAWRNRDPDRVLLFAWIAGTVVFAAWLNWTINARSVLPMVPAAAILIARRWRGRLLSVPLIASFFIAFAVTYGDYREAVSARDAARQMTAAYGNGSRTVWFLGHWGFQHYMQAGGARALDKLASTLAPDDAIVVPDANTNNDVAFLPVSNLRFIADEHAPVASWVATMDPTVGAGFYANEWGPLPFALAPVGPQLYRIAGVVAPIDLSRR